MAEVGAKEVTDFDGKPNVVFEYGDDVDDDDYLQKRKKDEDDDYLQKMKEKHEHRTSTHKGARPKVSTPKFSTNEDVVMNYDQMLKKHIIEEVKKYFPKISYDVDVRQIDGKIQISIYGSEEWVNFLKPNKKNNSFSGDLKKAIGKSAEKLKSDYFKKLKDNFPNIKIEDFELIFDEKEDEFRIRLSGRRNKGVVLFKKDGGLRVIQDEKIKNKLGKLAKDIIVEKEKENEKDRSVIYDIDDELKNPELDEDKIDSLNYKKNKLNETISEREELINNIEGRMKLGDRIRSIFKKHGLTIITITSEVVTVISAIVANLKIGLSKLAKNLGNGLKEIGKKIGAILPGMVGAIASFIFRTAGEAIGLIAKNAWLLIIAVIIYAVEQFKKKNK